jgi:hypothetical protein
MYEAHPRADRPAVRACAMLACCADRRRAVELHILDIGHRFIASIQLDNLNAYLHLHSGRAGRMKRGGRFHLLALAPPPLESPSSAHSSTPPRTSFGGLGSAMMRDAAAAAAGAVNGSDEECAQTRRHARIAERKRKWIKEARGNSGNTPAMIDARLQTVDAAKSCRCSPAL